MQDDTRTAWMVFRRIGLLWFTNRLLHVFGFAIEYTYDDESLDLIEVKPVRVPYRGFTTDSEAAGFEKLHQYMLDNMPKIYSETFEDKWPADGDDGPAFVPKKDGQVIAFNPDAPRFG